VMAHVVAFTERPGIAGAIAQEVIVPVVAGVCVAALPIVSTTVEGVKAIVGLAMSTATFSVVAVEPVLLVAVTVKAEEAAAVVGVPVMAQVVVFTVRPGIAGAIAQEVIVPVVDAVCVAATPTVSTTVEGVKAIVGLAMSTATFKVVAALPVLLVAVTVKFAAAAAVVGVPVMAQVVAFTERPGIAGAIAQEVIVPVVEGVCEATLPTVSTTVEGVNEIVGFAISTATFSVVAVEPVEFVAVIV
jgi:hypothetical protein